MRRIALGAALATLVAGCGGTVGIPPPGGDLAVAQAQDPAGNVRIKPTLEQIRDLIPPTLTPEEISQVVAETEDADPGEEEPTGNPGAIIAPSRAGDRSVARRGGGGGRGGGFKGGRAGGAGGAGGAGAFRAGRAGGAGGAGGFKAGRAGGAGGFRAGRAGGPGGFRAGGPGGGTSRWASPGNLGGGTSLGRRDGPGVARLRPGPGVRRGGHRRHWFPRHRSFFRHRIWWDGGWLSPFYWRANVLYPILYAGVPWYVQYCQDPLTLTFAPCAILDPAEVGYGGPFAQPLGAPYGTPYGAPYDAPYGAPYGAPYDAPYGAPFGAPYGATYGAPYGTPYETPYDWSSGNW